MITKPQTTIFAGVNGAGKTTLYYNELELGNDFGFRINIDEIVSSFGNPKNQQDQIRASKIAIKIREKYIQESKDFNQESTLCGASILTLFSKLKNKNYQINLYYIGVDNPELAKQRVKIRVAKGGHDVKDELIEKRYFESLKNLEKICHLCDKIVIFDNSKEFQKILEFENKELKLYRETTWLKSLLNKLYVIQNSTQFQNQNHNSQTKEKQDENLSYKEVNAKLDKATQEQSLRASKQKPSYDEQENIKQNNENLKNSSRQNLTKKVKTNKGI